MILLLGVLTAVTSSCSRDSITNGNGYVSGNGAITYLASDNREAAPDLTGQTLDGEQLELSQFRGQTVVVNVWGSWCAPCREEAPALNEVAAQYGDQGVQFFGVVIRDQASTAKAFADRARTPYPSILDPTSRSLLGFANSDLPGAAIPTTWIIDSRGRVAARVLNKVTAPTLAGLIDDVKSGKRRGRNG